MMEIWKDIPDFEGLYQVSNVGRVKSLPRKDSMGRTVKEKILKSPRNSSGYKSVSLHDKKNNKKKFISIHRLVADVFLSNDEKYPCVNHKDNDRSNNNVDNLEWCSYSYNNAYAGCGERAKETMTKKFGKAIKVTLKDGTQKMFDSTRSACKIMSLDQANVVRCLKGKQRKYKGIYFEYLNGDMS